MGNAGICAKVLLKGKVFMQKSSEMNQANTRKPYEKPTFKKHTPEEAKLLLNSRAMQGDQGAKELLELMFPDARKTLPSRKRLAELLSLASFPQLKV